MEDRERRPAGCEPEAEEGHCYHASGRGPDDPKRGPHGARHGRGEGRSAAVPTERNRYFTGKFMAARDFKLEQDYFLGRHRLHNRMLHGWGVVCGLDVTPHPEPECRDRWVVIEPGLALDCYGRELVLDRPWAIKLPLDRETEGEPRQEKDEQEQEQDEYEDDVANVYRLRRKPEEYLLCLRYDERETQMVPKLYAEDACDPQEMEANRISEGVCWDLRPRREMRGCWKTRGGERPCPPLRHHKTAYDDEGKQGQAQAALDEPEARATQHEALDELEAPGNCLDPRCPCGACVPVALIRYPVEPGDPDYLPFEIVMDGRWELPPAPGMLTHIVGLNWEHGARIPVSQMAREDGDGMGGALRVCFERPLRITPRDPSPDPEDEEEECGPVGINRCTFTVEHHVYADNKYSVSLLFNDDEPPYVDENDPRVAVFPLPQLLLGGDQSISRSSLVVKLHCDFILDVRGLPVDGDFLKGELPTGDGVPGGMFESWFYVKQDVTRTKGLRPRR